MKNKNILNLIKYTILAFFVVCLPFAFGLPNESQENLVILNVAVDKVENEYEVSFEYLIPQYGTSFSEKTGIITDKAKTVASAIEKIEMRTGKTAGLSHTAAIIMGLDVMKDNPFEILDFFVRHKSIGNYSMLIGAKNAKELLTVSAQPENASINSLANIIAYNNHKNLQQQSTIHTFISGYHSPSKTSSIIMLDIEEENEKSISGSSSSSGGEQSNSSDSSSSSQSSGSSGGQSSSSSQNEGAISGGESSSSQSSDSSGSSSSGSNGSSGQSDSSSSSSQSKPKKYITNKDETSFFFNGKFATILSDDGNKGLNLIKSPFKMADLVLENVNDENFTDAEVVISLTKTKFKRRLSFNNEIPTVNYDIGLNASIISISDSADQKYFYEHNKNYISEKVKEMIKEKLNGYVNDAVKISKEKNVDYFKVYTNFHKYQTKKWRKYVTSLDNPENYLENVQIFVNLSISAD